MIAAFNRPPVIAAISDVSIGYGSPQVPRLIGSLMRHYDTRTAVILEPDQSERPPLPPPEDGIEVRRCYTSASHYTRSGCIEYILRCAETLRRIDPDVLVVSSPLTLPVLFKLRRRPRFTIYYMLESLSYYDAPGGWQRLTIDMNRAAADMIDLAVFPEENRARADIARARLHRPPAEVVYNAINPPTSADHATRARDRNARVLVSGTIQRGLTLAEYLLRPEIASVPIDLYGLVEGPDKHEFRAELLANEGQVCYRGYVPSAELARIRPAYSYSLITWAGTSEHLRFACPNKFFEAVADGVPPIVTPHPQARSIIDRYRCGIVMRDWSYGAFRDAVARAGDEMGTPAHDEMIDNCRRAVRAELNWDHGFARLAGHLPALSRGLQTA